MNIRQLKGFAAVMDSGLISKAADKIGITQPAMSKMIKQIEDELGIRLFERSRGRLFPTPEANYLKNVANSVLNQLNEATRFLQDYGNMRAGDLRVMSIPGPSLFFLPNLINEFVPALSQVNASLMAWNSSSIVNWISNHQSGVGLVEIYEPNPFLRLEALDLRCVCALSKLHKLATKEVITPNDLSGENLALIVSDHPLFEDIHDVFKASNCQMNVRFQSDLFVPQFAMIEERGLIGIIDPINVRNYEIYSRQSDDIVFRRFEPRVSLKLTVVSPSLRPLSALENEFRSVLVGELAKVSEHPSRLP
ncbi:LysR family transcriptional regulator [Mesorhizobium sp. M0222]|uniref:LysR family transcriptional regulator n=1 Tax=Mesorhizobium sp. M0222 TaxID=2956921 RepID=UPI00333A161D